MQSMYPRQTGGEPRHYLTDETVEEYNQARRDLPPGLPPAQPIQWCVDGIYGGCRHHGDTCRLRPDESPADRINAFIRNRKPGPYIPPEADNPPLAYDPDDGKSFANGRLHAAMAEINARRAGSGQEQAAKGRATTIPALLRPSDREKLERIQKIIGGGEHPKPEIICAWDQPDHCWVHRQNCPDRPGNTRGGPA